MALGWAIYGTWNWKNDGYEILVHGDLNTRFFSHEIFWTRIARITRMFFCTLEHEIFLNTNNSNNTNNFLHMELLERGRTRISLISRILSSWCLNTNLTNNTNIFCTQISFFKHTDLTDLTDLEPSARCERQFVVVIDSLWLLARCGYWLVVVIDLLWLLTRYGYWLVVV